MASWLVLDLNQDQFHVLSVQTSRRGAQVTRAVTWTHPEPLIASSAERVGKALRDFLKAEKIAAAPVLVGIGRDRILLKELRFPPIAAHEEAALVRFQTAKELTEGAENYAIDYAPLNADSGSGERQIMTVATRRELVATLQTLCQAAGLKLHGVTPRLFGVASALTQAVLPEPTPLVPNQRTVVLSLGQRWAELCFFRGPRLEQVQALAKGPLLASEIKRNLAVFQAQHAVEIDVTAPPCLYVFGEDAAILQALQTGLPLPITVLNPLAQDAPPTENPGAFAGALGLALLWSQSSRKPVNLVSPKKQQAPVSAGKQRGIFYGAAAALAAIFLFGSMYYVLARKRAEIAQLVEEKAKHEEFLKLVAQDRADLEAYKEWEQTTIPWLDELYDLTARYPHETGFRVNQFAATTTSKKNAKDGFVGRISLVGITPHGKEAYVHQLHSSMARDPHVRVVIDRIRGSASGTAPQEFQMKIDVAKQNAAKFGTQLTVPRPPVAETEASAAKSEEGDDQ